MKDPNDYSPLDTIKYSYKVCGIFKIPARPQPDNIIMKCDAGYER